MSFSMEDHMSIEELRRALRRAWDFEHMLMDALRDAPEFPPTRVLHWLGQSAQYSKDWEAGKRLQRIHGLDVIPPVSECECGAGLWTRIRSGLLASPAPLPEKS